MGRGFFWGDAGLTKFKDFPLLQGMDQVLVRPCLFQESSSPGIGSQPVSPTRQLSGNSDLVSTYYALG